jgi:hypothetical protein
MKKRNLAQLAEVREEKQKGANIHKVFDLVSVIFKMNRPPSRKKFMSCLSIENLKSASFPYNLEM